MELYPDLCRRLLKIKMLSLTSMPPKFFEYQKGTADDVSSDTLAFLNYVDSGIVSGKFFEELDAVVSDVKSNEKARHDFMTFQMTLLEHEIEAEDRRAEEIALKLIRMRLSSSDIRGATNLPLEKIQQLTNDNPKN